MIPKGAGSIRSLHSLNTRPGTQSQPDILRRMYILACEEDHLKEKKEWLDRQKNQVVGRLGEIGHTMSSLKSRVSERQKERMKGNPGGRFNSVPLKY